MRGIDGEAEMIATFGPDRLNGAYTPVALLRQGVLSE